MGISVLFAFLLALSSLASAQSEPGYLVLSFDRQQFVQEEGRPPRIASTSQSFKLALTPELQAQFKNVVSARRMGTSLRLVGGTSQGSSNVQFHLYVRRTHEGKLSLDIWGQGGEELIDGEIERVNPIPSLSLKIPDWSDVDLNYHLGFEREKIGVNFYFRAESVGADDVRLRGMPALEVKRSDGSVLVVGEMPKCELFTVGGRFQEK